MSSCNPCCCWKLRDAVVTIGIWSFIYCLIQLGIFGWQMAAIKYEKDRAGNTLLPNYNTYGRYDIPAYYESYWQSPEERYYTALFIVQILCLIVAFFLLFSSVILVYGVHTWSRFLIWPWVVCMLCSILTSLAYCITWWAGDVRDYWLVLTILQFFGVVINCYCFVVVWVFYQNMANELRFYEGRRNKYDRFNQRDTPPTVEEDLNDDEFANGKFSPIVQQPWDNRRWPQYDPNFNYPANLQNAYRPPHDRLKMPPERFDTLPIDDPMLNDDFNNIEPERLQPAQSMPTLFDDFRDVPRQHHRESSRRRRCSRCDHRHHRHSHKDHRHRHSRRRKVESCSSTCSTDLTTEYTVSTDPKARRHRSHHDHGRRRRSQSRGRTRNRLSDDESQPTMDMLFERSQPRETRSAVIQVNPDELTPPPPRNVDPNPYGAGAISIPQHIVIPPENDSDPATNGQPRKYQINSEITISYDPRNQTGTLSRPDSRQQFAQLDGTGSSSGRPLTSERLSGRSTFPPVSMTSNV
ncbi:hypothetical protein M3Y94_01126700 [Aphelenchoides besseyi]|nr:hypothetical protein M3Y94_01126700 [Aphelenchoides besseyi]